MGALLYIPWFKLDEWNVPILYLSGVVLLLCGLAAVKEEWRGQAFSTAGMASVATVAAYLYGVEQVPIQPFGILVAIGVLTGSRLAEWQGKAWGVRPSVTADFITHVTVIGLVTCYVLNGVFYEWDVLIEVLSVPAAIGAGLLAGIVVTVQLTKETGPRAAMIIGVALGFAVAAGVGSLIESRWLGLSSFGGFVGGGFALWVWKQRRKMPAMGLADIAAWCFPAVWVFGRSGCFVVHDHPGSETTFFLGVQDFHNNPGVVRHDLGLYEVIWALGATALFFYLRNRQTRPTGFFLALLPLLYTPVRFGLDFLRATDVAHPDARYAGLTPAQYGAVGFFFFSLYFMRRVFTREAPEVPANMAWPIPELKKAEEPEGSKPKRKKTKKKRSSGGKKKKKPAEA